ncbi:MAG: cation:dicarboxylate symporter family transporter [Mycoplasma sp.]
MEFLKQFLGASETPSQVFLGLSLGIIALLIVIRIFTHKSKNDKLKEKSWNITLYSGIILSIIMGLTFAGLNGFDGLSNDGNDIILYDWKYEIYKITQVYANIFLSSIFFVIAPLIFFLMSSNVINSKGKGLSRSVLYFTLGVLFAGIIAILFAQLFRVVPNYDSSTTKLTDPETYNSIFYTIVSFIPRNVLASNAYSYSIIGILIGALVIGFAISLVMKDEPNAKEMKTAVNFLKAGKKVFIKITEMVLELLPIGVFGLLTRALFFNSLSSIVNIAWFFLFLIISILIVMTIQTLIIWRTLKINPIEYFKKTWKVLLVAFTTQSSNATLPLTEKMLKNDFEVSESIASATPALGTTIGMVACGSIYPALATSFIGYFGGLEGTGLSFDSPIFWIMLIISVVFASFGLAGTPGVASVSTITVMDAVGVNYASGLGANAFGTLLGFDPIIDMFRTMANVNGSIFVSLMTHHNSIKTEKINPNKI